MSSKSPLLLPEILSKVLKYVDSSTLKTCRLVSAFWNVEAGRILSSSCSVEVKLNWMNENAIARLQQRLANSSNPGLFFGKFRLVVGYVHQSFVSIKELEELLLTYGKYLKSFELLHWETEVGLYGPGSASSPSSCLLLIHRVLTQWCPFLRELILMLSFGGRMMQYDPIRAIPLDFIGPMNLRRIELDIRSQLIEIPESFQDFFVQLVAASMRLKVLSISRGSDNDHMYEKITALQHITDNLTELTWHGKIPQDGHILSTTQILNNLKTLRIESALVDPRSYPFETNSIGQSLKTLELMDSGINDERIKEFQACLFKLVIKTLVNLETLRIGYKFFTHDHLFSNADGLNAPPHQNLRKLLLPWRCSYNLFEVSSVSNIVKWFPNLTVLSLCFGVKHSDIQTTLDVCVATQSNGVRLHEAVRILSGLKRLKDLSVRVCSNTTPGELQLAFQALTQFPRLLRCTFIEFGLEKHGDGTLKTTYYSALEDLEDDLKELQHLTCIRLMGFKFIGKETILNFAKETGIKLEIESKRLSTLSQYDNCWLMTYP